MVSIYVLELKNSKYYVGRTNNINFRLKNHFNNRGSAWTVKHPPIKIHNIYEDCDIFDEDKYTIKMMSIYGIENVRGGAFTKIILPINEIEIIIKMINNASDKCFNCHFPNHFCGECPYIQMNNNDMNILRDKIIDKAKEYDRFDSKYINIENFKIALYNVDNILFGDITENDIYKLCDLINNLNIKGINKFYKNCGINYVEFSIGFVILLDK